MNSRHPLYSLDKNRLDCKQWPTIDVDLLPEKRRNRAIRYRDAIIAIFAGAPVCVSCRQHSLCRREVWRQIQRCLVTHNDGKPWGFRALAFQIHQKKSAKAWHLPSSQPRGLSCAFTDLLDRYPAAKERVVELFLKRTEHFVVHDARIPIKSLHRQFLQMLRELGVNQDEYPFTTKYCGYRSMGAFLKRVYRTNLARAAAVRNHPESGRLLKTVMPSTPTESPPYPLQRVMADGHRLDAKFAVRIAGPTGVPVVLDLERLWLFVIIDVASRAVLGYHLSLEREYTSEDVLRCVEKALVPWKQMQLTIPSLRYPEGGGLPNGKIPEFAYATWTEMFVDNGKANLSDLVRDRIKAVVGCSINAGPVAMPERRPFIERFFGTLTRNGFQRLPSTTGGGPKDGRRDDPGKAAIYYEILLPEMEQLLDVMIADYNNTEHSSLHGHSPLSFLRQYVDQGNGIVPQIPEGKRADLGLMVLRVQRTVRGNPSAGRRPYLTFEGVTYHNEVLSHSPDLVGKRLLLHINVEDVRSVVAFLDNGSELGVLTARGYWGVTPHDLRCRRAIQQLKWRGLLRYFQGEDPIVAYLSHLEQKAKTHKHSRAKLISVRRSANPVKLSADGKTTEGPLPHKPVGRDEGADPSVDTPSPRPLEIRRKPKPVLIH